MPEPPGGWTNKSTRFVVPGLGDHDAKSRWGLDDYAALGSHGSDEFAAGNVHVLSEFCDDRLPMTVTLTNPVHEVYVLEAF
jgi:hypothetical protein